jgi:hypothetical protein
MAADASNPLPPPEVGGQVGTEAGNEVGTEVGTAVTTQAAAVVQVRPPRSGELTNRWRIITGVTWALVVAAIGAVWRVSDQLGLSTWWLGPRGEPQPRIVQLLPFVPGVLMMLIAINRVRYVAVWGLLAASLIVATGVADLGRVVRLGLLEVMIGAAAAAVSLVSLTGTYRRRTG